MVPNYSFDLLLPRRRILHSRRNFLASSSIALSIAKDLSLSSLLTPDPGEGVEDEKQFPIARRCRGQNKDGGRRSQRVQD